ncbi:phosphopantetheine-binding protein [Micromonospora sp. B11E3]|uniref:acyl carrier protein n=1 Tax=Micromonospora sp. B11E3 TaxID=3153562 RepID=UPI00325C4A72
MLDTIRNLLVEQFEAQPTDVHPDAELEDLLQDSLDMVEFGAALGEALNVHLSDEEMSELTTVGDLLRRIESKGTSA